MRNNTRKPPARSSRLVKRLYDRLFKHYGPQHWWPAESAWEMMVGAILTQNTAWTNVEKALNALKRDRALSLSSIATMPRRRLEKSIRPSGYFRQKAKRLQAFAREMQKDPEFFRQLQGLASPPAPLPQGEGGPDGRYSDRSGTGEAGLQTLRTRLLSLQGIGPETADSILLYAGDYPIFVVDAYTRRLGHRIGLFKTDDYHDVQRFFEGALPRRSAIYNEFHALIVAHSKAVCTSRNPRCSECPVASMCAFAKRR